MRIRHTLAVTFGFKLGIILLCFSLVYVHRLFAQSYFDTTISKSQQRKAVQEAANVDARNQFGLTGLMVAAIYGDLYLAKLLVNNGAHLNLKSKGTVSQIAYEVIDLKKPQQTALHFAVNNLRSDVSKAVAYYLIGQYANVRLKNGYGDTPLNLVGSTDDVDARTEMVTTLIKNGADINDQNFQGDTLIHTAVNLRAEFWLQTLIEKFGPLINFNLKNKKGLTPYEYALQLGFTDTASRFKKPVPKMPAANAYDPNGLTGLMLAVMKGDQKILAGMVDNTKSLDMQSQDDYRNSALHIALLFDNLGALKTLLEKGASPLVKNARGEIPVQFLPRTSDKQRIAAAKILIPKNPQSILSKSNKGENLLHYIVRYDNRELLSYLIKNYKNLVQQAALEKNNKLQSPVQLADQMRRRTIAKRLRRLRVEGISVGK